jgi:hypothetical protein
VFCDALFSKCDCGSPTERRPHFDAAFVQIDDPLPTGRVRRLNNGVLNSLVLHFNDQSCLVVLGLTALLWRGGRKARPTRIERRARVVNAIARGRRWLDEIRSETLIDVAQIARRQKCSVRQVNMTISLAFLAPDLVRAAVEGRLPRGIGVERLRDPSAEWSGQFEALGLKTQ